MGLNPNLVAFLASICFGIVVFPWQSTIKQLGPPGVFLFVGGGYLLTGIIWYAVSGFTKPLDATNGRTAVLTAVVYVCALVCCNYAFASPEVKIPIAAALTAGYPVISAVIAFLFLGARFTKGEAFFFVMAMTGLVGMGLSSKR